MFTQYSLLTMPKLSLLCDYFGNAKLFVEPSAAVSLAIVLAAEFKALEGLERIGIVAEWWKPGFRFLALGCESCIMIQLLFALLFLPVILRIAFAFFVPDVLKRAEARSVRSMLQHHFGTPTTDLSSVVLVINYARAQRSMRSSLSSKGQ